MKVREWAKIPWNHLDAYSAIVFYIGFALSYYDADKSKFVLAVALLLFYLKLAKFFRVSNRLGPYLAMIYRMVRKLRKLNALVLNLLQPYFISKNLLDVFGGVLSSITIILLMEFSFMLIINWKCIAIF